MTYQQTHFQNFTLISDILLVNLITNRMTTEAKKEEIFEQIYFKKP